MMFMFIVLLIALLSVALAQVEISGPKVALELHNLSEEAIACADFVGNELERKEGGIAAESGIETELEGRHIQHSHIISGSLSHETGPVYDFKLAVTGTAGNCRVMIVQAAITDWVDNTYVVYHHEVTTEACPPTSVFDR